jgi:two-component system cell cycle sensor histidine kinase/response regulator CckA
VRSGGEETILVVDDEMALCEVAGKTLELVGYKVLKATDGEKALEISEAYKGDIHLLLTDVVMPCMNGKVLAEKFAKSRPGSKVLFMSGYSDEVLLQHEIFDQERHQIGKPFSGVDLTQRVREVLDGEKPKTEKS